MNILIEKVINDANALCEWSNDMWVRIFNVLGWGTRYLIRLIVTK